MDAMALTIGGRHCGKGIEGFAAFLAIFVCLLANSSELSCMKKIVSAAFIGLGCGCLIAVLALVLSGMGHGWNSTMYSWWAVLIAPVASVAWSKNSLLFLTLSFVSLLVVDWLMITGTYSEGLGSVNKAFSRVPFAFLLWTALWAGLHLILVSKLRLNQRSEI